MVKFTPSTDGRSGQFPSGLQAWITATLLEIASQKDGGK